MLISPADIVARAKATITECSVTELEDRSKSDTLLIDIREPAEFDKGHIPGAVHLPRGLLEFDIHKLVKTFFVDESVPAENRTIFLYCGSGGRSALAAQSMEALGYTNVASVAGGFEAWNKAQLPVDRSD